MLLYQGMVVLAASQVWWTWEVEDVFHKVQKGEKQAMKEYGKKMHQQIDELVTRITMPLNKNDRKKYNTVLIIDVHARDIVDSFIRDRSGPVGNGAGGSTSQGVHHLACFPRRLLPRLLLPAFSRPGSLNGKVSCGFTGTGNRMS